MNTVVRTPEEARAIVSRQKAAGYDFIKVYATLSAAVYREIVLTGQRLGIPVTGHVPSAVGVDGVLASGQVGVDHVSELMGGDPVETARRVREAGVGVTTTLIMLHRAFALRGRPEVVESLLALPEARYISPATRKFWREAPFLGFPRADPAPVYSRAESMVRALEAAGVPVMVGDRRRHLGQRAGILRGRGGDPTGASRAHPVPGAPRGNGRSRRVSRPVGEGFRAAGCR